MVILLCHIFFFQVMKAKLHQVTIINEFLGIFKLFVIWKEVWEAQRYTD